MFTLISSKLLLLSSVAWHTYIYFLINQSIIFKIYFNEISESFCSICICSIVSFFLFLILSNHIYADEKPKGKLKKDPRDFTDNDVNNLFEEWEVRFIKSVNLIGIEII